MLPYKIILGFTYFYRRLYEPFMRRALCCGNGPRRKIVSINLDFDCYVLLIGMGAGFDITSHRAICRRNSDAATG